MLIKEDDKSKSKIQDGQKVTRFQATMSSLGIVGGVVYQSPHLSYTTWKEN